MGILSPIPFDGVAGLVRDVLDRFIPDPTLKAQAIAEAQRQAFELSQSGTFEAKAEAANALAQAEVNKAEAGNPSLFVSGWRPFVGWVCGMACAWNWIVLPALNFGARAVGHPIDLAQADLSQMLPLLFGMLGLGALRTVEKVKGVA